MAYQLLDIGEEEELFKARLLNVEEKPFKRITKRLATLSRVVAAAAGVQEQTPPPEGPGGGAEEDAQQATQAATRAELLQLREDITLDFAAFDASIARLQFLGAANARERARYAEHRVAIDQTCRGVRHDTLVALRSQLATARATLQQRQAFDALADKITGSKTLWPRPEQQATIDKLQDECRQLQRESEAYTATWRERKQQFARIMDESMRLRRLIRDEKEEVERREGMDDEAPAVAPAPAATALPGTAPPPAAAAAGETRAVTPAATPVATPAEAEAPKASADADADADADAQADAQADADDGRLRPEAATAASRNVTPAPSTVETPVPVAPGEEAEGDDVDMVEVDEAEAVEPGQGEAAAPGPAGGTPAAGETMDTT